MGYKSICKKLLLRNGAPKYFAHTRFPVKGGGRGPDSRLLGFVVYSLDGYKEVPEWAYPLFDRGQLLLQGHKLKMVLTFDWTYEKLEGWGETIG